ncbi:motility protein B [bacterium BMS3Abin04]|nr:motility protein B [bacterium BMS3Abin04]
MITYADLITLLLGLFIILYAISNIDVVKYEKMMAALGNVFGTKNETVGLISNSNTGGSRISPIQALRGSLQSVIDQYGYGENVKLLEDKRGITIRILDNILFTSGDAELNPKAESVLHKLALVLKKVPNDIRVEGHTDNIPIKNNLFPSNWQLSVARATNTAYYLMKNEGLSPEKVSIVGYAEYKPIATNDTPEGRALNRRVDIVILKR